MQAGEELLFLSSGLRCGYLLSGAPCRAPEIRIDRQQRQPTSLSFPSRQTGALRACGAALTAARCDVRSVVALAAAPFHHQCAPQHSAHRAGSAAGGTMLMSARPFSHRNHAALALSPSYAARRSTIALFNSRYPRQSPAPACHRCKRAPAHRPRTRLLARARLRCWLPEPHPHEALWIPPGAWAQHA